MKKALLIFGVLFSSLTACKEDSLVEDNPNPPAENIELNLLLYYGEEPLKMDSIYTNSTGAQFSLDTVSMLVGDISFYDRNLNETVDTARNYVLLSSYMPTALTGQLPAMGYYGNFSLILGADSTRYAKDLNSVLEIDPSYVRKDLRGFNFFNIKGRYLDPASPPDEQKLLPLEYTLGTYRLTDTAYSDVRGFSVDNLQQIKIFLLCDLKPMLDDVPIYDVPEINSDPTDSQDFTRARAMADSLNIGIF